MEQTTVPTPSRRRLNAKDRALRRKRIFARLREGWAYDEIAREERLTTERVREIVNEVLLWRRADLDPKHALLQLARLAAPLKVASEAVAGGDVKSISPLLRTMKAIDAYQKTALAHQSYADKMSEKLIAKFKRLAIEAAEDEEDAQEIEERFRAADEAWARSDPAKAGDASRKETARAATAPASSATPGAEEVPFDYLA
jgi:hypothetical protein